MCISLESRMHLLTISEKPQLWPLVICSRSSRNSHDFQTLQVKIVKSYDFTDILSDFHVYAFWILGSLLLPKYHWLSDTRLNTSNRLYTLLGTNMSQDGWQGEFFLATGGICQFSWRVKVAPSKRFPGFIHSCLPRSTVKSPPTNRR